MASLMPSEACTQSKALSTFITVMFRILEKNIVSGVVRLFSQWSSVCCDFFLWSQLSNFGLGLTIGQELVVLRFGAEP